MNTIQYNTLNKSSLVIVLLFIFLIPWGDSIVDGFPAVVGMISFAALIILLILEGTHRNYSLFHLMVILLWTWALFSVIWTYNFDTGIEVAKRALQIMILPFVFSMIIIDKNRVLLAYQSYVVGNTVGSMIIISNFLNGIQSPYYNRYGIDNIETDLLGIMLAISIPIAAYLNNTYKNKWLKTFNLLAIPLILYAIFLTGTRTATLVSIIGLAYWLFSQKKASIKIKLAILFTFVMTIILLITFAPKASLERAYSSVESISSGTLNYRTVIWSASIDQWKKSPVIGTGIGGLKYALNKSHVNYSGAHNTYLEFLTEMGIVGLALYLILITVIFHQILRCPFKEKFFLLSLLMVILITQITQHSQFQKETWFALTMIVIHAQLTRRRVT